MTIKQAFEYLASECGIGMKNPFIALRNLVEGFSKVADEIDPMPTGDFVKKSGDTMTGPLVVEDGVTATKFSYEEPALGGTINLVATPSTADVDVHVPNKSGTLVLTSTVYNYTLAEKKVGSWLGSDLYQIVAPFAYVSGNYTFYAFPNAVDKIITIDIVGYGCPGFYISSTNYLRAYRHTYEGADGIMIEKGSGTSITEGNIILMYTKPTV